MLTSSLPFVLALSIASASANVAHTARVTVPIGQIWAYGTNITGVPLIYADGKALIGNVAPHNTSVYTNVTWADEDSTLVASATNTTVSSTWTSPRLFIDTTVGAFGYAGFTSSTTSNTTNTITEFSMFGTLLVWVDDEESIESRWYAEPVEDGVWALKWNTNNTVTDDSVLVVLKNRAPILS